MQKSGPFRRAAAETADPRLDALLRHVIAIGAVLVLLLPAARGSHDAMGWLPLWLLAMPLAAWWALHRFSLPRWSTSAAPTAIARRRIAAPQARRRIRAPRPRSLPRAA